MPENPSADGLRRAPRVRTVIAAAHFTPAQKLALLAINAWPLAHILAVVDILARAPGGPLARGLGAAACLLLLPPLLARLVVLRAPLPTGENAVPSAAFFRWWATWQLQMVFNRLPWIEETLRLVPGLYSSWLRLWGARVGRLALWSPDVRIFDRPLLRLGNDVVLGIDARLVGHFGGLDRDGRATLTLGPIFIEDRCTLGGGALLGPGVHLGPDQATETLFLGAPFTRWQNGQRVPPASVASSDLSQ